MPSVPDSWREAVELAIRHFTIPGPDSELRKESFFQQIITPSLRRGPMNVVQSFDAGADECERRMDEVLEPYTRLKLPCWWVLTPSARPTDLQSRLERRGFRLDHHAYGLIAELPGFSIPAAPDQVTVEKLDESNLDDYIFAAFDGQEPNERLRTYFRQALAREAGRLECFLARIGGEPAGTAILHRLTNEVGNLGSGFVRPRYRGQGTYRSLVAHRIKLLERTGGRLGVVLSKAETSAPILQELGFRKVMDFSLWERSP